MKYPSKFLHAFILLLSVLGISGCESRVGTEAADTIYHNARIFTVDDTQPWAEAVAIRDGLFVQVGSNDEVLALAGPETRIVDLGGRTLLPGLYDMHTHPTLGSARMVLDCQMGEVVVGSDAQQARLCDAQDMLKAARHTVTYLNSLGITSTQSAVASRAELEAFKTLDDNGELSLWIAADILWHGNPQDRTTREQKQWLLDNREQYRSAHIDVDYAKIFLDGVPFAHSAVYLDPYVDDPSVQPEFFVDKERFIEDLVRFDKMGMTVKVHAVGDGTARAVIDAVEVARRENGPDGPRHQIGHAAMIHPEDLNRVRDLNMVIEASPILWYPSATIDNLHTPYLGERIHRLWAIGSYVRSGAVVAPGSDWPAAVETPNLWPGIEAMVSRANPFGEHEGEKLGVDEAIDLESAIRLHTRNGAWAMGREDRSGSIEAGKIADLIVLDRDLFSIPVQEISETEVVLTLFEGRPVHSLLP